jgi:hypothetical protein
MPRLNLQTNDDLRIPIRIWEKEHTLKIPILHLPSGRNVLSLQVTGDETKPGRLKSDLLKNPSLDRDFRREREEILKHMANESGKAGWDPGFERALIDWIIKHRTKWRKGRQSDDHPV